MLVPMRAVAFGLMTLVLSWHGAGAPMERADEECSCEEADALASSPAADDHAEDAHETCPPDCDGCSCCGGASMLVTLAPSFGTAIPVQAVSPLPAMEQAAPRGEVSGVFRPPRA